MSISNVEVVSNNEELAVLKFESNGNVYECELYHNTGLLFAKVNGEFSLMHESISSEVKSKGGLLYE